MNRERSNAAGRCRCRRRRSEPRARTQRLDGAAASASKRCPTRGQVQFACAHAHSLRPPHNQAQGPGSKNAPQMCRRPLARSLARPLRAPLWPLRLRRRRRASERAVPLSASEHLTATATTTTNAATTTTATATTTAKTTSESPPPRAQTVPLAHARTHTHAQTHRQTHNIGPKARAVHTHTHTCAQTARARPKCSRELAHRLKCACGFAQSLPYKQTRALLQRFSLHVRRIDPSESNCCAHRRADTRRDAPTRPPSARASRRSVCG